MNKIELEQTQMTVPDLAELAKQGTVILTLKGKPMAAVKNLSGTDWESISLANNPQFTALIEASRQSYREQGGVSLETVREDLGLPNKRAKRKPRARGK